MNYFVQKLTILLGLFTLLSFSPLSAQCDSMAIDLPYNGIDEDCDYLDGLHLRMPTYIYMSEGKEFDLFYRNVILSKHPASYTFSVATTLVGENMGDHWHFVPNNSHVGSHALTLEVKNSAGIILASASSTVRIAAAQSPAGATGKKFIQMGHSLVDQGVMAYYLANHVAAPGTPFVTFHGTHKSFLDNTTHHEGRGGASWNYFHTDPQSPLLLNGQLNIRNYFNTVICSGCNPELFVIQLDVNDYCFTGFLSGKTFEEISDYIDADYQKHILPVINALRAEAPNMKIGICLPPPANNRPGIFLNHFGPGTILTDNFRWKKIVNGIYDKYTQFFDCRTKENIYIIPIHLGVDDINHFDDVDPIHPYPSNGDETKPNGYRSAARSMFAWMKIMMEEDVAPCHLDACVKNIKCNNNGTESNPNDDTFTFDMKVTGRNVSNGYDALLGVNFYAGTYDTFKSFGPLSTGIQGVLVADKVNDACPLLVPVSKEACSFGTVQFADLELSITAPNVLPALFTNFSVTYTLKNKSNVASQAVWVKLPKPAQANFPGADPYLASQGTFDWFYTSLWEVGDIPANSSATITVDYFLVADEIFPIYAEVYSALQPDKDSKPHNGDYITPHEDDEALLLIGILDAKAPTAESVGLNLFPNPVTGEMLGFTLKNTQQQVSSLEIVDAQGRVCQSLQSVNNNLSIAQLPKGMYIVRARLENGLVLTERFVRL